MRSWFTLTLFLSLSLVIATTAALFVSAVVGQYAGERWRAYPEAWLPVFLAAWVPIMLPLTLASLRAAEDVHSLS